MLFDALLLLSGAFSANLAMSGQTPNGAGSILSTNTIDMGSLPLGGNQGANVGRGEQIQCAFRVLSAPTVGTSVEMQLIQADDAALTANVQVIGSSGPIPIAELPAGTQVIVTPAPARQQPKRYVGARYVNVGAIATFSVMAGLVLDSQSAQTSNLSGFGIQ